MTDTAVSGSQTFDLATLFPSNYQNLTADNFVIDVTPQPWRYDGKSNVGSAAATFAPTKVISNNILTTNALVTLYVQSYGSVSPTYKVYYLN